MTTGLFAGTGRTYLVHVDDPAKYDGAETLEVTTDGRDWAAMEARQFPPNALLTIVRFLAWNALKREGKTRRSWEQFNLIDCTNIEDITPEDSDADGEDEQRLDPGPTRRKGRAGSTSP